MANSYSNDWLEELKARCNIVDIVGQYVKLTKKGNKYFGCCPFHNEKTGSFCVNEDSQYYHCFGCGVSGDVLKFVQEIESISFMDAVKLVAEKVNFQIPEFQADSHYQQKKEKNEILLNCMYDAYAYYYTNMRKPVGKDAVEYLTKRGISQEVAKKFGIGLSTTKDGLVSYLRLKNYSIQNLVDCGLVNEEYKSDSFYNRIIVPILNTMGKVVAFGGRIYHGEENLAKYKNSTNTNLFDKSRTVYGLNFVKKEKHQGLENIILVEGYMDVISLASAGFNNAVASMGTSLTEGQVREILRVCKNILVCYDGDGAGKKASVKNVELLSKLGAEVKVICLPDGADPDDFVRKNGAKAFHELCENALPMIEYKLKLLEDVFGLDTSSGRARYAGEASKVLAEIDNEAERAVYADIVSKQCGISVASILKECEKVNKNQESVDIEIQNVVDKRIENESQTAIAEKVISNCLILKKEFAVFDDLQREWFSDKLSLLVYDYIKKHIEDKKEYNVGLMWTVLSDYSGFEDLVNLNMSFPNSKVEGKFYNDCAIKLADLFLKQKAEELAVEIDNILDYEKRKELLKEMMEITKKRQLKFINGKKL